MSTGNPEGNPTESNTVFGDGETPAVYVLDRVDHANRGIVTLAVTANIDTLGDKPCAHRAGARVVGADDNEPARSRDLSSKIVEGVFKRVEGLPMIQVVGFDVRDDPHNRRQREERTIALVCFHDEQFPRTQVRIRP